MGILKVIALYSAIVVPVAILVGTAFYKRSA